MVYSSNCLLCLQIAKGWDTVPSYEGVPKTTVAAMPSLVRRDAGSIATAFQVRCLDAVDMKPQHAFYNTIISRVGCSSKSRRIFTSWTCHVIKQALACSSVLPSLCLSINLRTIINHTWLWPICFLSGSEQTLLCKRLQEKLSSLVESVQQVQGLQRIVASRLESSGLIVWLLEQGFSRYSIAISFPRSIHIL